MTIIRTRALGQVLMLAAQFILGMAVNLLGQPTETQAAAQPVATGILWLHILLAAGLVINGLMIALDAQISPDSGKLRWSGLALVVVAVVSGILTTLLDNNGWSYAMALGFIGSFIVYGWLLLKSQRKSTI